MQFRSIPNPDLGWVQVARSGYSHGVLALGLVFSLLLLFLSLALVGTRGSAPCKPGISYFCFWPLVSEFLLRLSGVCLGRDATPHHRQVFWIPRGLDHTSVPVRVLNLEECIVRSPLAIPALSTEVSSAVSL